MKNLPILLSFCLLVACQQGQKAMPTVEEIAQNEQAFKTALKIHLDAISARDLKTLEATLSPQGDMHLILPQTNITTTAKEFMDFHRDWFEVPGWTMENKIVHTNIGQTMGIGIVEALYKEEERDGKPYFNRMHVSYSMKKIDDIWYVVKDHASSVEKSTDKE